MHDDMKLLTPSQVAALLGVSRPMIYKLMKAKELDIVRVGTSPRFEPQAIQDYIERQRKPAHDGK